MASTAGGGRVLAGVSDVLEPLPTVAPDYSTASKLVSTDYCTLASTTRKLQQCRALRQRRARRRRPTAALNGTALLLRGGAKMRHQRHH
jgi:hypothetical protein